MTTDDRADGPTRTFTGHAVLDEHGESLGSVTDVVYDLRGDDPEYLVVDPGIFRAAHYVPVAGSYQTTDGRIVVPWERHWVRISPKASGDHILSSVDRRTLEVHYAGI